MDIRERFSKFDDDALLNVKEVAELLLTTPQAIYKRLARDPATCPAACVRSGGQTRFRVSDVRAWLRGLTVGAELDRTGRPRLPIESENIQAERATSLEPHLERRGQSTKGERIASQRPIITGAT